MVKPHVPGPWWALVNKCGVIMWNSTGMSIYPTRAIARSEAKKLAAMYFGQPTKVVRCSIILEG